MVRFGEHCPGRGILTEVNEDMVHPMHHGRAMKAAGVLLGVAITPRPEEGQTSSEDVSVFLADRAPETHDAMPDGVPGKIMRTIGSCACQRWPVYGTCRVLNSDFLAGLIQR